MSVDNKAEIIVQNLADHKVVFVDEDSRKRISFEPFEKKTLTAELLRRLNYSYGGSILLTDYLSVKNAELAREFGVPSDMVEYNWSVNDVDKVLTSGSLDELLDALDYGPDAIRTVIIDRAIKLEINDVAKRNAIYEATGTNIDNAIKNHHDFDENIDKKPVERKRRVNNTESVATGRRVQQ